jgi:hypothetical protein
MREDRERGCIRVGVKQQVRYCADGVRVDVRDAASTKTGSVVRA